MNLAHFTGIDDIDRVVEPVVMQPMQRRWEGVRAEVEPYADAALVGDPPP